MSASYKAPLSDLRFALYDVLGVEPLFQRLGYPDATRDILDAVLDEAARFSETVLAPLNGVGDEIGCSFDKATGAVTTPPGELMYMLISFFGFSDSRNSNCATMREAMLSSTTPVTKMMRSLRSRE